MSWFKRNLWPQFRFVIFMVIVAIAAGAGR
jgi:hypothetical protein